MERLLLQRNQRLGTGVALIEELMLPDLSTSPERQPGEQADAQEAGQKRNDPLASAHARHRRIDGLTLARACRTNRIDTASRWPPQRCNPLHTVMTSSAMRDDGS